MHMASNSSRKSGSSGRSNTRRRVIIGAHERLRVRYDAGEPVVESERTTRGRARPVRHDQRDAAGAAAAGSSATGAPKSRTDRPRAPRSSQGKRLADTKRKERELRQRSIRLRRLATGIVIAGVVTACVWGGIALAGSDLFKVTDVAVSGTRHLDPTDVEALAKVPQGATMFSVSARRIQRDVESSPWVEEARVTRDFPHTLRIAVRERVPAVVVDAGGTNLWVVSRDGLWLGERSAEESGVPVLRDVGQVTARPGRRVSAPEIRNAAALAAALSDAMRSRTAYISAPTVEKTAVITDDRVEIFFGEARDVALKERIALEILNRQKGRVVYINVRVVESPTWRGIDE